MIQIDTSALVDALTGPRRSVPELRRIVESGERIQISAIVLYEWERGPRLPQELEDQELLFPRSEVLPFGSGEAALAARLYREVARARGREIDIAIAACAIAHGAALWTLNRGDFADIPELRLHDPRGRGRP